MLDLAAYIINKANYLKQACNLIAKFINLAYIIAAMPMSFKMLVNYIKITLLFIIINKAGCIFKNIAVMLIFSFLITLVI